MTRRVFYSINLPRTNAAKKKRKRQGLYGTMTVKENNRNLSNGKADDDKDGEVPDGGWGWLVVFGVSISNMTTQALVSVFGFLFSQRLAELNIETSGAAIILSVQSTFLNLSGLFTGALIRKYSYQRVAISGALLMVSGLMLTTMANSLFSYVMTYGVFTGLGLGFLYPSTFMAVNSYFSTKKGIAVGWSVTGTGIGQMILPLLVSVLLESYGFRGTILVLAGLSGHSLVGALLYQPVSWHTKKRAKARSEGIVPKITVPTVKLKETKVSMDSLADINQNGITTLSIRRFSEPIGRSNSSLQSVEVDKDQPQGLSQFPGTENEEKINKLESGGVDSGVWDKFKELVDVDLLKDGPFLLVIIGSGIIYTANNSFQMLFPLFLESMMYTRNEVATCMMSLSACDIIGRPVLPYIVRFFKMRAKTVLFVSALFSALMRSVLATQSGMVPILVLSAICGLFRSAIITHMNLTVAEQTTLMKLPGALGLQMISKGLASMTLGPLVGVLRDQTLSFTLCIHLLSLLFLGLPFLAWVIECLCIKARS